MIRLPLRLLPRDLVVPIIAGPLRRKRWIVGSATHGCWLGSYEREKLKIFASMISAGDVVYDIGANAGIYTLLASSCVEAGGEVHAFEPLPENVSFLQKHILLNRLGNVFVHQCAVSKENGVSAFAVHHGRLRGTLCVEGDLTVRTVSLDKWVFEEEHPEPNLIKIDVEGAELNVLTGAIQLLRKVRPVLLLATHSPEIHVECLALLGSLSYIVTGLENEKPEVSSELLARPSL